MARTTTFIFETTGGSPIFHIPFPISTLQNLAQDVQIIFRNIGGSPQYHVGGAEIGVGPSDAFDYDQVVQAVLKGRTDASETGGVRVKLEDDVRSPGPLRIDKGKARAVEPEPEDTRPTPPEPTLTREEREAFARGTLTRDNYDELVRNARADMASACNPNLPPDRTLTDDEQRAWQTYWDAVLHMDRVFFGPLRNLGALRSCTDSLLQTIARDFRGGTDVVDHEDVVEQTQESGTLDIGDGAVESARAALRPLHQAMLSQSLEENADNAMTPTRSQTRAEYAAYLRGGPRPRARKENAGRESSSGKRSRSDHDGGPVKRVRVDEDASTSHVLHKLKGTCTANGVGYVAWIPPGQPSLTPTERQWLAEQSDLARPPDYWRPVRWLELGERMYQHASGASIRPLHHSVLLSAWDQGEWRFPGHEHVGRVDVSWADWIRSEDGQSWRASV